jgi:ABC-type phosphate transport system substrate-binding protein
MRDLLAAKSTVTALSKNQVTDIFLGKTNHFPDGSQAVPIDQVEGSGVREEFYLRFAVKTPALLKAHWSKIIFTGRGQPPKEVPNNSEVKKLLAGNPAAISYIDKSAVDGSVKALTISP